MANQTNPHTLVTGGAGYIGSHFIKRCGKQLGPIVVIDNLSRGHKAAVPKGISLLRVDLQDRIGVLKALKKYNIESVFHFAAYALVGESMQHPRLYYENNIRGGINLLEACAEHGVKRFIFSSTAATYGIPRKSPIAESTEKRPINPYGASKSMFEEILLQVGPQISMSVGILRYFNAAGAADDGSLGEHHEPETHLIPSILQSLLNTRIPLKIYGDDYPTKDGSCIRDYVHVYDLADAHLLLHKHLKRSRHAIYNVGSGAGFSVFDIVRAAQKITGQTIRYDIAPRRPGDPPVLVADTAKIRKELRWKPRYSLDKIVRSAWLWHLHHPKGYRSQP